MITVTYSYMVNGTPAGSPVTLSVSPYASPPYDMDIWLAPDANMARVNLGGPTRILFNLYPSIQVMSPLYPGASTPQPVAYFNVGVMSPGQSVTLTASATVGSPSTAGGAFILIWGMDTAGLVFTSVLKVLPSVTYGVSQGDTVTYRLTVEVS